ncbi:MAG: aminotransferase class I/II-fold pyridoxal phosphate-dependent enzyme [Oscillospiraceae bacterium]|nr:aminotransferase class I/II-fold pyridoxal phosphate-dependent enzyme [Oscillospiraceae bacterium]MBQ4486557.1 aminotransferase class I/II-fold pyridoxal phosphate-dependent enzyme [Oscillospiraceae bacterium]
MSLKNMSRAELEEFYAAAEKEYEDLKAKGLKLDMSRGKPSTEQLELSRPMLDVLNSSTDMTDSDGIDTRNYGGLTGITEAKELFAELLGVRPSMIIVGGNSSLNLMYDSVQRAYNFGVYGGSKPWCKNEHVKFLCPVPGYDRHFGVTETFGIEMINVPLTKTGPDMDMVEKLVSSDPEIKGIWCVPMYSNPDGYTYSDETVTRFAKLKPAADDFRIFWDNAYCVHHLCDNGDTLLNIFDEAAKYGNEDMIFEFASTSKITFPGSGVAVICASENNVKHITKQLSMQNISYDKVNQLRHVRYFGNADGIKEYMKKHRDILAPKFDLVSSKLDKALGGLDILSFNVPNGGYFISVYTLNGCAKEVVKLCAEAGVVLTGAGASYPYKKDPDDSNIRLSPSYPTLDDLSQAMDVFTAAVKVASARKLLGR